MSKFLIVSSLALALIGTTSTAEAVPQKRNVVYTMSYDYDFGNESDITGCLTRASAALANNGLGNQISTKMNEEKQSGIVYGWNRNGTETAEIACNRSKKKSFIAYAAFSDDADLIWKNWKLLKDSNW